MPLDDVWIARVADLTVEARRQLNHGRKWDAPGVVAAIRKVSHLHMADVVAACMRAAADRTINTPAPIGDTRSSAWRERIADQPVPPTREVCREHGTKLDVLGTCTSCVADKLGADGPASAARQPIYDSESVAAIKAELKDQLAAGRERKTNP